jgi:hypothetical protein
MTSGKSNIWIMVGMTPMDVMHFVKQFPKLFLGTFMIQWRCPKTHSRANSIICLCGMTFWLPLLGLFWFLWMLVNFVLIKSMMDLFVLIVRICNARQKPHTWVKHEKRSHKVYGQSFKTVFCILKKSPWEHLFNFWNNFLYFQICNYKIFMKIHHVSRALLYV